MPDHPGYKNGPITRIEVIWPGKYREDGSLTITRPPCLPLIVVERHGVKRPPTALPVKERP